MIFKEKKRNLLKKIITTRRQNMKNYRKLYHTDYINNRGYRVYKNDELNLIKIYKVGCDVDEKEEDSIEIDKAIYDLVYEKHEDEFVYGNGAWHLCDELYFKTERTCSKCGQIL